MLSASNIPLPTGYDTASDPTSVLLLPAFTIIENVTPSSVPALISQHINRAPTNTTPFPATSNVNFSPDPDSTNSSTVVPRSPFQSRPCPHKYLILLCSQRTRDARCGQSAPLLRRELERHLRPLGLYRDLHDERPGGVGIYFISHVGGHKYSANMMIYRRGSLPMAAAASESYPTEAMTASSANDINGSEEKEKGKGKEGEGIMGDANQCIWLARVRPEDCEGIIKFTVLQGKVVKPEKQLRGGFDREKGLVSW